MDEIIKINAFPSGVIKAPASKSVAHRTLICAGICGGGVKVENLLLSQDIKATLRCISALGAEYEYENSTLYIKKGIGFQKNIVTLDCGESGSTLRFFIPIVAALGVTANFIGAKRLFERPLQPYAETLTQNGVTLTQNQNALLVSGKLKSGSFSLRGDVSSQFVTGLLFALTMCSGESQIDITTSLESKGYVDLTLGELTAFGADIQNDNYKMFTVKGQPLKPIDRIIEGDYSGAAFLLCSAVLGCKVTVSGLNANSLQGDKKILDVLKLTGAKVDFCKDIVTVTPPKALKAFNVDVSEIPDLVPPIAAVMAFCDGESQITNAARLRIKETDRLATVTAQLNTLGADVTEKADSLIIKGKPHITGGECFGCNDHRIAMMCAVAAIKCKSTVTINGYKCVDKSYPSFFSDFCGATAGEVAK